jgi:hypothetical protein
MKFNYKLSMPVQDQPFEAQLSEFCANNKFNYNIRWNEFANDVRVYWLTIEFHKLLKFPNGEFIKFNDGRIKKEKIIIYCNTKVIPTSISLNDVKDQMAKAALETLFLVPQPNTILDKAETVLNNKSPQNSDEDLVEYSE